MAQFLPPDHEKGDANTIGGYMAVHDRPAAFEGSDGFSYSVEILTEQTGRSVDGEAWGAYFLFIKWARIGAQNPEGHLETDFVAFGSSADEAAAAIGALPLSRVKELLDDRIATSGAPPARRWWDAMRAEGDE